MYISLQYVYIITCIYYIYICLQRILNVFRWQPLEAATLARVHRSRLKHLAFALSPLCWGIRTSEYRSLHNLMGRRCYNRLIHSTHFHDFCCSLPSHALLNMALCVHTRRTMAVERGSDAAASRTSGRAAWWALHSQTQRDPCNLAFCPGLSNLR